MLEGRFTNNNLIRKRGPFRLIVCAITVWYFFITSLPIKQFQILVLDNHPIGAYHISTKSDHLVLDMILVEPKFQGQGWGRSLLKQVKTESRKLGRPVRLSVLKANPAVDFHLKEGFEEFASDEYSIKMLWTG